MSRAPDSAPIPVAGQEPVTPPALTPSVGWNVVHLFCKLRRPPAVEGSPRSEQATGHVARDALDAIERARKAEHQVVTASILGHKADLCVLGLGPDLRELRSLQTALQESGLDVVDSYVSLTEVSEYAGGVPDALKQARLYPQLPPAGLEAFCFYPMSKRRAPGAENWYSLGYEERLQLMYGHGAVGREFRGRVLQLVTGSTGLDDFEWGVTLFGAHPDDLKDCVYTMRFDEASASYAEFGRFYSGFVSDPEAVLAAAGAIQR
ncbi:MAG: chlorite dismutase family protein [Acidimicrobiales bacterium]